MRSTVARRCLARGFLDWRHAFRASLLVPMAQALGCSGESAGAGRIREWLALCCTGLNIAQALNLCLHVLMPGEPYTHSPLKPLSLPEQVERASVPE